MKKIITLLISFLLINFVFVNAEVLDAEPSKRPLAVLKGDCEEPYCSTLSPDYWMEYCVKDGAGTSYKYYCGDGKTCENGNCVPKGDTCTKGYIGDYYCSQLSNAKLRQYQNSDCSITTSKWNCGNNEICKNGACVLEQEKCDVGYITDYYCSGLSNTKLRMWQREDCSTVTYKWNCDEDEKCENGKCNKIITCTEKWLTDYYCSNLDNARLRQKQICVNNEPHTETSKWNCDDDEICQDGKCIDDPNKEKCDEKWVSDYYCSDLSNAKLRQKQEFVNGVCSVTSYKYDCDNSEVCEDGKCVGREQCKIDDDCEEHQECKFGQCINLDCIEKTDKPCEKAIWQKYPICQWNTGSCPSCTTDEDCKENEKCENEKCVSTKQLWLYVGIGVVVGAAVGLIAIPYGPVVGGLTGMLGGFIIYLL